MKVRSWVLTATLLVLLCTVLQVVSRPFPVNAAPTAQASVKMPQTYDLTRIHCSDLLGADLLDRSSAIMFLWGFEAGKQGVTTFDTDKLEYATRELMNVCEKQPSLQVFAAIAAVKKSYGK
jgi:hypothetical protein